MNTFFYQHGIGYAARGTVFEGQYYCYSMAILGRENIDDGDKIILPASALDVIAQMNVEYPLLFELTCRGNSRTHCGVLEFSAEEGRCYLPFWMMKNLNLSEGALINVKNASLSKATFVKFKPQSVEFLEITNPRAVLERTLRKFTCLTVGDIIHIKFSGVTYMLRVVELKPQNAVSIVETDCEVDFEEPEGYKESKYYKAEVEHRERALSSMSVGSDSAPRSVQKAKVETATEQAAPTFEPFTGSAKRIDGKKLPPRDDTASLSASAGSTPDGTPSASAKTNAAAAALARFSGASSTASASAAPAAAPVPIAFQSKIGDKFSRIKSTTSAFTGTARKLT